MYRFSPLGARNQIISCSSSRTQTVPFGKRPSGQTAAANPSGCLADQLLHLVSSLGIFPRLSHGRYNGLTTNFERRGSQALIFTACCGLPASVVVIGGFLRSACRQTILLFRCVRPGPAIQ